MQFLDISSKFETVPFELPFERHAFNQGVEPNRAVTLNGVTGFWVANQLYPEIHFDGPWRAGYEDLWRHLGHPSIAYWAAPDEDLSFFLGMNDKLRSLRLMYTGDNELALSGCTNLRFLSLGTQATTPIDLTPLSELRSLSTSWREHTGLEALSKLEMLAMHGGKHPNNVDYLASYPKLRWLHLSDAKKVKDLSVLESCTRLEKIWLNGLSGVTVLPNFADLKELYALELINLKKANLDFSELLELDRLRLVRALKTPFENIEMVKPLAKLRIGIDLKPADLKPSGKYSWLADRYLGQYD